MSEKEKEAMYENTEPEFDVSDKVMTDNQAADEAGVSEEIRVLEESTAEIEEKTQLAEEDGESDQVIQMREYIGNKSFKEFRLLAPEMNEADVASLLEELPENEIFPFFRVLPKHIAADVFAYLPIDLQQSMIVRFTEGEAANIIDNMYVDDAADLFDEMPANVVTRLLAKTSPETRRTINQLLQYPDSSAGSLMTTEYEALKLHLTVAEAIEKIRTDGIDKETINICYVLDRDRKLLGTVTLRQILLSKPDAEIGSIMTENVISVTTLTDQEDVARDFQKYDFSAMPVTDSEGRLVGIITVDDIVDILQEEATEDIEKMAAISPSDMPYVKTGVFETWKKRIPWLLLLMISATFTGMIISHFEEALSTYIVLTSFIPMLMDTGGNAGSQASVSIIRALSLGELEFADLPKTVWKEARVSLLIGATLAVTNFVKLLLVDRVDVAVAAVVCLTLVVTVFVAKLVGCSLPMIAKKIGFDPAVMASPFITTIVDALSLLIYFSFAQMFLGI
ncbi:MAG: magnesium transporter [Lachnospiraceae bacterium]|nr:magnesium transporter [Lachnospiraceae bacterium]